MVLGKGGLHGYSQQLEPWLTPPHIMPSHSCATTGRLTISALRQPTIITLITPPHFIPPHLSHPLSLYHHTNHTLSLSIITLITPSLFLPPMAVLGHD